MSEDKIPHTNQPSADPSMLDSDERNSRNEEDWQRDFNDDEPKWNSDSTAADSTRFVQPMRTKQVWIILTGIFLVIAVAVLYVYQAGDTKTILGNQPIPQAPYIYANPVGLNFPAGVANQNPEPNAAIDNLNETAPIPRQLPTSRANTTPLQNNLRCPTCNTTGLPVCSSCGTIMRPLQTNGGSVLYYCPSCGKVGTPLCPHCGKLMNQTNSPAHLAAAP